MSICEGCIHDYVCGLEDNHDEALVSCDDWISKNILDKIRTEIKEHADRLKDSLYGDGMRHCIDIIDKYKVEGEVEE